jgi:HK97 gp10 family phage protein
MASASIEIKGLEGLKKKLRAIPENVTREVDADMQVIADAFVNRAQADAPVDRGQIKNYITANKEGVMNYEIVSGAPYSAYIEFGTKSRFKAIPGIDSSKFKGKGSGSYYDFLKAILEWVERKGIASRFSVKTRKKLKHTKADNERILQAAEAIAFSIMKHGVNAHPFFFKQLPIARSEAQRSFRESVKKALSK